MSMERTVDLKADEVRESKRARLEPTSLFYEDPGLCSFIRHRITFHKWCEIFPVLVETKGRADWWPTLDCVSENLELDTNKLLSSGLVGVCVVSLSSGLIPHFMNAIRVLSYVSFTYLEAPNVPVDKVFVANFVLRVLCESRSVEVQRQVCLAISLKCCRFPGPLDLMSDGRIPDQLIKLVRGSERNAHLTLSVLGAICRIAMDDEGMREKIFRSELSDSWFGKLMFSESSNDGILEEACLIVACIACRKNWEGLWDHVVSYYMPAIATIGPRCWKIVGPGIIAANVRLLTAGAFALMNIIYYASDEQIWHLVSKMGCLDVLFGFRRYFHLDDGMLFFCFVVAVERILELGEYFALKIDLADMNWEAFLPEYCLNLDRTSVRIARRLVKKHRPELVFEASSSSDESDDDESDDEE